MASTKNKRGDITTTGDELVLKTGTGAATTLLASSTADRTITLPDVGTALAGYDAAQTWTAVQSFQDGNLRIGDADNSHYATLKWNEGDTADRVFSLRLNGADRTIDMSGSMTLGANFFTQNNDVTLNSQGNLATLVLPNATAEIGGDTNANDILTRTGDQTGITNKTFTNPLVTAGGGIDTSSAGTLSIGATSATDLLLGRTGQTVTAQGNFTVTGDFTVQGTNTIIDTEQVTIEDPNMVINSEQNQANADGIAGLTVEMSDATDATLIYDSTLTSRWKIGDVGSEVEIATVSGSQTITSKSIDADNNTITNIDNADIKSGAAIDRSKLASGSADHVLINNGSGVLSSEAQLAISRGGTGQSTAVAAFDALAPSTTNGDLIGHDGVNNIRIPGGSNNQILTYDTGSTGNVRWGTAVVSNPMDATGDIIYSTDGIGTPDNLAIGAPNTVLTSNGTLPAYSLLDNDNIAGGAGIVYSKLDLGNSIVNADINSSAAIAYSKLNLGNSIVNADINSAAAIDGTKIDPDFGSQTITTSGSFTTTGGNFTGWADCSARDTNARVNINDGGAKDKLLSIGPSATVNGASGAVMLMYGTSHANLGKLILGSGTGGTVDIYSGATLAQVIDTSGNHNFQSGDLTTTGNLYIGDSASGSSAYPIHVRDSSAPGAVLQRDTAGVNQSSTLLFIDSSDETSRIESTAGKLRINTGGTGSDVTGGNLALEINASGNVTVANFLGVNGASGNPLSVEGSDSNKALNFNNNGRFLINTNADSTIGYFQSNNSAFTEDVMFLQAAGIGNSSNYNILRGANSSGDKFVVRGDGNVGIGTTSPSHPLDIAVSTGGRVRLQDTTTLANGESLFLQATDAARSFSCGVTKHSGITNPVTYTAHHTQDGVVNYLWVDDSDVLRISTTADHRGTTSGTVVGDQTSDERLKENIRPTKYGLSEVMQLAPIDYEMDGRSETGFGAQTTLAIIPEAVYDTGDAVDSSDEGSAKDRLAMQYTRILPAVVKAIQELKAEIDALKSNN